MLDTTTKRKIDSARQILVGKVPDPKAQVEQITTALIYKFMDDMDKESQELGGKARFFTNNYEKYAWAKIMDSRIGGQSRLNLYVEAITTLSQNPHLPQLFRDIFKDAFLPYRDSETLNLFLKEINGFTYDHSENLGDAFEYLLSILGSQGEAGQFRTPRHIIDFIVESVAPKKDETICDPACGTAGFLISAFKYILKENKEKPLTPDEKKNLMDHFVGYDISPDMVRLSKVNLYLHGFPNPTIFEYDTLSSEEKWDENFDVMLANPPFMSPKGGIRPHKRFSVQANRAEVLFVDYILEHLRPNGRAGIIVPEGIIFQSATAYKSLRKLLIEDGLLVVVSLPPGVFNPYSGVKTSILLFDNGLAKKTKDILFLKISNDGFDLGAQRREIDKNDLPQALEIIKEYRLALKDNRKFELNTEQIKIAHLVAKEKIAETNDYNLSGDRYIEAVNFANQKWPMVELGEICELGRGRVISKKDIEKHGGIYPVYSSQTTDDGVFGSIDSYDFDGEYVTWTTDGANAGTVFYRSGKFNCTNVCGTIKAKTDKISMKYLATVLNTVAYKYVIHVGNPKLMNNVMAKIKIPLPPIEVQKEIVEQIEVKQKTIEAAKSVIENLEREKRYFGQEIMKIKDVEWVELGEVCDLQNGYAFKSSDYINNSDTLNIRMSNIRPDSGFDADYNKKYLPDTYGNKYTEYKLEDGDVIIAMTDMASDPKILGVPTIVRKPKDKVFLLNQRVGKLFNFDLSKVFIPYLKFALATNEVKNYYKGLGGGGLQINIGKRDILSAKIPLPSLEIQKQLVAEMEEQEKIIEANKKLIEIMEQKIAEVLSEI